MPSVLIVDDHTIVRRGLRQTLADEFRGVTFGEARNSEGALRVLAQRPWDLMILDIALPDRDGFETLQSVCGASPETKVLMFSAHSEPWYAMRAMKLGACGYVTKGASLSELLKAIRCVLAGKPYFSAKLSSGTEAGAPSAWQQRQEAPGKALSGREREVLAALGGGKGVGAIAAELGLDIRTVSTYKRRILNKLQLDSSAALIRYVIERDIS